MDWLRRIKGAHMERKLAGFPRGELIGDTSNPLIRYSVRVYAGKGGADLIIDIMSGDTVWGAVQMNKLLYVGIALPDLADMMSVSMGAQPDARMNGVARHPLTDECQAVIRSHPKWEKLRNLLNGELKAGKHIS
jgi:hypothetical protein